MTTALRLAREVREALRFQSRGGLLRNLLPGHVPQLAAEDASGLLNETLQRADTAAESSTRAVTTFCSRCRTCSPRRPMH